jgi:flavin-dependent dehydrogenase
MSESAYDLAIIGAGPAGSALALRVARGGASVLLVDRDDFKRPRFGETAPPLFRRAVAELELDHLLDTPRISREAPAVASVWGQDEPLERHHFVSPYSSAVHLDRQQFDRALALEAGKAGASVHLGTGVIVTADPGGDYVLQLRGGETERARFLALAVGRSAGVGRFHQRRYHLNDHTCMVGYLSGEPGDSRTLIEAVRDGWIYAAALPGQRMVAALTTSAGMVPNSAEARLSFWRETIARSLLIAPAVTGLSLAAGPFVVSSRASAARRVGGKTWCVLGDARMAPDPLSGQGLLWALDDAALVANRLLRSQADSIADELRSRSQANLSDHCEAAASIYAAEQRFAGEPFWINAATTPAIARA